MDRKHQFCKGIIRGEKMSVYVQKQTQEQMTECKPFCKKQTLNYKKKKDVLP